MRRVAANADGPLTPAIYRQARKAWKDTPDEVAPLNRIVEHFGSWMLAREALDLADAVPTSGRGNHQTTVRRIEARFRERRLGKVWRYTDQTLGEFLHRCAADLGRAPMVSEFEHWRRREIELAKARGDRDWHLPGTSPYRKRWGTWQATLEHFQIPGRDERWEQQT